MAKKWKPTKAYNLIGLSPSLTVDLHDGQLLSMGPHTWRVPTTETEDALWKDKLAHSNPPHYTVTTCPVKYDHGIDAYVPIPPEPDMTDLDREALRREEESAEEAGGTIPPGGDD